ncbi:MAG: hypothetical protein AAB401_25605, partial [Acidobacteriota bacterium]
MLEAQRVTDFVRNHESQQFAHQVIRERKLVSARIERADLLATMGRRQEAVALLHEVIAGAPGHGWARLSRPRLLAELGRWD